MSRTDRQARILELVQSQRLGTQQDLVDALAEVGHHVTQTTVSRDIAELRLVKVRVDDGRLVYARNGAAGHRQVSRLSAALRRWAIRFEASGNIAVIVTPSGFASALAQELDDAGHPDVLATLAGDNTILVVATEGVTGRDVCRTLETLQATPD